MTNSNKPSNTAAGAPSDTYGAVTKLADGRTQVSFERQLPHSIGKVWAAITAPEQLAVWFPGFRLELRQGGTFEIWFGGDCEGVAHVSGIVSQYDPPRVLECGTMCFELQPQGAYCLLRFTDVLVPAGSRSAEDITHSVLGGWHKYLDMLEEALAGRDPNLKRSEPDYSKIAFMRADAEPQRTP